MQQVPERLQEGGDGGRRAVDLECVLTVVARANLQARQLGQRLAQRQALVLVAQLERQQAQQLVKRASVHGSRALATLGLWFPSLVSLPGGRPHLMRRDFAAALEVRAPDQRPVVVDLNGRIRHEAVLAQDVAARLQNQRRLDVVQADRAP